MNTLEKKNAIKQKALKKLDYLVSSVVKYYNDTHFSEVLDTIGPPDSDYFSKEEFMEVKRNLETINESIYGLLGYCRDRGIESPILDN